MKLNLADKSSFLGNVTTVGRITGRRHTVTLRLVFYNGKFYASRRTPSGNWFKNILKNPTVLVNVGGKEIEGHAEVVKDEGLSRTISEIKYTDKRRQEKRVIVEITP